jgi:hypothetical protein
MNDIKVNSDTPELLEYIAHVQSLQGLTGAEISFELGSKYIRVIRSVPHNNSAHTFVDRTNGNILKSASWKAPTLKNPRGNIFTKVYNVDWCSAVYLRGY